MPVRFQRLYLRLYATFLAVLLAIGAASLLSFIATSRRPLQPRGPNWGTRVIFHLTRTLSGITDDAALREILQGAHDDLDVDLVLLSPELAVRASAGAAFELPPLHLLEHARRSPTWLPPSFAVLAAQLDDRSVLVVRFPGPTQQRRRLRWIIALVAGLGFTALLLYPLSRSITRPLEQLTRAAEAFGKGDLLARTGIDRTDEVGQLARTFDEMAARIETARRAERELLANVSHELRTPLARIQVALELLDARDDASKRRVAGIREEVDELNRLIGDVLTTSKLELSALPLQKRELALGEIFEKVRARAQQLDPERRIDLDVDPALTLPADETLLSRVLDNLVDNARKYDPSGKPVRLEARRDGDFVSVAVQDGGPGIPPEDLGSIFEPFFRGHNARSQVSGFGLGLALARRVAEAHGGTIGAANVPGGGARLELRLPAGA